MGYQTTYPEPKEMSIVDCSTASSLYCGNIFINVSKSFPVTAAAEFPVLEVDSVTVGPPDGPPCSCTGPDPDSVASPAGDELSD